MQITREIREFAREHSQTPDEAVASGMRDKAEEFRARGGRLYP